MATSGMLGLPLQRSRYAASHGAVAPLWVYILAHTYINGIMVFGYVAIDVIEASIANLDVYFAAEYQLQEPDEGGYDFLRPACQVSK